MALVGSLHQRGGAAFGFTGIHIGAVFEQRTHGIDVARACGQHQRAAAQRQLFVGIGTALEQCFNHGGIAARRRQPQRRGAIVIGQARLGAGLQQPFGQFCVAAIGGPLQRSGAIALLGIHVGTAFQQTLDFRLVARSSGIGNVSLRERGAAAIADSNTAAERFQCKATHHTRPGRRPVLSPKLSRWMSNWSRMLSSRLPVGTCLVGYARWRPPLSLPLLPPTRMCGTS